MRDKAQRDSDFMSGTFVGAFIAAAIGLLACIASYDAGKRVGKLEQLAAKACMTDYECEVIVGDNQ